MSKILPQGTTISTVCNDVITKTLESIRIGQQAAPALSDLYNIIIGVNAGYSVNYVNNCIFFGFNSGNGIKTGSFNIIFGNNYNNSNYVNFITTIGYDNLNYDKSSIIGTSNTIIGTSNYIIGYNNKIIGKDNYIIGNDLYITRDNNILYGNKYNINGINNICLGYGINIINDNSVILGLNSNIYGNKNIIIGNYNTNYSNVILIGNKNKGSYIENSIIIGNNIDDYRFSLNIDNTICKYTQNSNSTIFLGIGYNDNSTPVLIGFKDVNIITSNKSSLYIKGGLAADELRITNSSNYYISLKNNEDIKKNIIYTLPPIPTNTDNILLSSDSNGILNWLNVTNFQILHLIVKGTLKTTILNANNIAGDGSSLININLNKNTTNDINEGIYTKFYNDYRITTQFDNYVYLHSTDILNQGILNFYFDYEKDYKNFLLNVEYTTTDSINEGTSNIYYSSKIYNKYDDINYSHITTDILQEGTSNFYFTKETDYLYFNKILASNTNTDYLPEGTSNLYFTQQRFNLNFYSNLNKITTNNLKQGTSNLYYNSNLIANVIYTTDNIKEGKNNYFLNIQRVKNIINSIIITTDNLKQGKSNLYYNSNINFTIISDNLRQGRSNLYYTSNLYDKITTDNINIGSSNLYFNSNLYRNNFNSNIITLDYFKKGIRNNFIYNNTYNDNLNILGTLYCCNINNIFSNINDNLRIGSNTIVNNIYETNNIDIVGDINCDINFTYNYYDDFGSNLDVYTPLIVTETNVGINNINPIHSLDVVGKIRADEYIGAGSNIYDINWDNIVNIPKIRTEYDYYKGNFAINDLTVSLKNIYATNNQFPIIIQNNYYDNNFNNINNTNDYYYVFTSTNSNSIIFNDDCLCKVFMIGGGGGGGDFFGGGGGAGSFYYDNFVFSKNKEYKINIGLGGQGGIYNNRLSKNGGDTYISFANSNILSVNGGGYGGGFLNNSGGNGGNGGGGTGYSINNIINNGGNSLNSNFYNGFNGISDFDNYINTGGGGGGCDENGINGNGGSGILINIKNIIESYGGGGGGGGGFQNALGNNPGYGGICYYNNITYKNGGDGGDNDYTNGYDGITFGSGGGGGGYQGNGGNGANGCLIIKFSHSNITKFIGNLDDPSNPSYTWNDTINTGIYHSCNLIGFSINGIEKIKITNKGIIGDYYGLSNSNGSANIVLDENLNMIFNNNGAYNWYNNSSLIMQLSTDGILSLKGSTTIFNLSDKNLKYDIKDLENSLEIINKINPVSFKWKENVILPIDYHNKEDIGFIAQEMINIIPSSETNYFNYKAIRYEKIIPYLVKSIQILERRIIELEKINI